MACARSSEKAVVAAAQFKFWENVAHRKVVGKGQ